ncbi:O-antigen ligase domain-containing protein [Pseudomonas kilonensis]|uniref:O-antigen ligase domain-containing protein n=1 Tax=Pseudomonas kilonensis TaxID=132476 RepID=UPI000B21FFAB|nr:O-antigen ligase domain-containing protein [Pseudomonas kilonensis]
MIIKLPLLKISQYLFALLFPGTILYYVAVTSHIIPPLAGGYFGVICALSLLILFPLSVWDVLRRGRMELVEFSYTLFLFFFTAIVIWNGVFGGSSVMAWHLVSVLQSLAVFTLCKRVFSHSVEGSRVIFLCWLAASICILTFTLDGRFILRGMADDVGQIPSYQTFALCYFIATVFIVRSATSRQLRMGVHIVALACLYINSARSEFAGYVFFALLLEFLSCRKKFTPIIIGAIVIGLSSIMLTTGGISIPESRVATLVNLQEDNSNNERDRMAREGMEKIFNSPIVGAYGEYEEGGYIHNVMSVWQETGIVGGVFFALLAFLPFIQGCVNYSFRGSTHQSNIAISLLATSILLLIVGKYFTYLMLPAALAIYASSKPVNLHDQASLDSVRK